jgi:hypothetical protein
MRVPYSTVASLVCYDCVPRWWLHKRPELSTDDRQKAERQLRNWLVSHYHPEVIGQLGDLPEPERLLMKLVTDCEQCNASGKNYEGKHCSHCDGRGTVWVGVRPPPISGVLRFAGTISIERGSVPS